MGHFNIGPSPHDFLETFCLILNGVFPLSSSSCQVKAEENNHQGSKITF